MKKQQEKKKQWFFVFLTVLPVLGSLVLMLATSKSDADEWDNQAQPYGGGVTANSGEAMPETGPGAHKGVEEINPDGSRRDGVAGPEEGALFRPK